MSWDPETAASIYSEHSETWSAVDGLRDAIDNWEQFIRSYWGLDAEGPPEGVPYEIWEQLKRLSQLTEAMYSGAVSLTIDPPGGHVNADKVKGARDAFNHFSKIHILAQLLELRIANDNVLQMRGLAHRVTRLLGQVNFEEFHPRVAAYLKSACNMYLAGYGPEVAVMCRAALEQALNERLERDGQLRVGQRMPLEDKIDLAEQHGVLSAGGGGGTRIRLRDKPVGLAHGIRKAGNHVVHDKYGFKPPDDGLAGPFEVIRALSRVLDDIFANEPE